LIQGGRGVITVAMKLVVVLVFALGTLACGGKKSSSTTSPTPTMKGTGGSTYGGSKYGGATYGGNAYGGSKYGGKR
jgi:hypothetical protein